MQAVVEAMLVLLVQAVFVATSYPSVPRMDLALAALMDQQPKATSDNVTTAACEMPCKLAV